MADNRISSFQSLPQQSIAEGPHPAPVPTAGPTSNAERNRVEEAERQYATATLSPFESTITDAARRLGPHQSVELNCKALVSASLAAKVEGKIAIERRDDGAYEVTAFGGAVAGVGAGHAGKAMAGVAAGTKFVVNTPEAAADLAQAIATAGGVAYAHTVPGLFPWSVAIDKATGASAHAMERLDHYRPNLSELKGEARVNVGAMAEAHVPGLHAHGSVEALTSGGVKIDFEKGELTMGGKVELNGELRASLGLGNSAIAKSLGTMTFDVEVEGKHSGRVEARMQIPPAMLEKLKHGELSPEAAANALANAKTQWVFVGEIELEKSITGLTANGVGKAKLTTEIPLEGEAIAKQLLAGDLGAIAQPLLDAEWEVEGELGIGPRLSAQSAALSAEAGMMTFVKTKSEKGSLRHCLTHADQQLNEQVELQKQLDASRH